MTTGLHSPSPSPRRHRFAEVQQDDEDEDKSDVSEMIDELESSASGESDGDAGGVGWEERLKWWKVYAFHFLFMWNSNTIEYVSVSYFTVEGEWVRADSIDLSGRFCVS